MRQKLFIFLSLFFLVLLLVGLNAASYVQKPKEPDSEENANRSTYHAGATGTRAFYDLLGETGRKPVRWQEKVSALLSNSANKPQTFVVIGQLRREFTDEEIEQLLRWVSLGGRLVVIDREPRADLISTTANWQISAVAAIVPSFGIDPFNTQQMTEKMAAKNPVQPTLLTRGINAVQPSRFASSINLESFPPDATTKFSPSKQMPQQEEESTSDEADYDEGPDEPPPPAPRGNGGSSEKEIANKGFPTVKISPSSATKIESIVLAAPVVHVADNEKTLLVDFPYGSGQVVFLSDPYIVSNAGISLVDNAQLAINIVASGADGGGAIAFDEYHQGYGANENQLLAYFSETPIPAIFAQIALLIGVILFTQSRRFARPLPASATNRLSKLEYVSAMAELQGRTRAYDLAIENIYAEFRRRTAKSFGVDNYTVLLGDLAALIAERAKLNSKDIENLMLKCEDIIRGEPTGKKEVLEITSRLRETEEKLGLKRTRKQAFGK